MNPPSKKSLVLASANKDTKQYSDFEILKYLKGTHANLSEDEIVRLSINFSIDISHMRCLLHTSIRSQSWI